MSPEVEHPSFLELDRLRWEGGPAAVRTHVASCAACAAHLERVAQPVDVPSWARALEQRPRGWRWRLSSGRRWAWGVAFSGAMAALVLLLGPLLRPPEVAPGTYVGVKGGPTVVVHVRHGQAVTPWNGSSALVPGDSVRLEVAAPGYPQVLVGSRTAKGELVTLYAGTLQEDGTLLPTSWRVDAEGESEHLVVVLSRAPLSPAALRRAVAERSRTQDVWVTELHLPKQRTP